MKKAKALVFGITVAVAMLMFGLAYTSVHAQTLIGSQMSVGSTGSDVSTLQAFLATNPQIYPEGLVTGYYGPLTRSAVIRFQAANGIDQVGNVGPITLARINSLIAAGLGYDLTAPVISNVAVQVSNTFATMRWTTDTYARGKVHYSTTPFQMIEGQANFTAPVISGAAVEDTSLSNTSENITLQNLSPNTTYFYVVESTDASGNVSMTWPSTFQTNP